MPARRSKADLLPLARSLAANGQSVPSIARSLAIPTRTLQRWAQADAAAGNPWTEEQSPARFARGSNLPASATPGAEPDVELAPYDPTDILSSLRARLRLLATGPALPGDAGAQARAIYQITKAIESIRREVEDPTVHLMAINAMTRWASVSGHLDTPLRNAVPAYLDHLKTEAQLAK